MASGRRPRVTIPLPGAPVEGRRAFLKKGLLGAALLAVGGGTWLGTRRTRPATDLGGALQVFSAEEATVLAAIAERLVPERAGFPRPRQLGLVARVDAVAAMAHPATQQELRQLVRLFEGALAGLVLDGQPTLFTASTPEAQDRRLRAWSRSRIALRRTGYRALKKLVYAAYYAAPETWAAVGYPGPPIGAASTEGRSP
jgi:hypothetical protein